VVVRLDNRGYKEVVDRGLPLVLLKYRLSFKHRVLQFYLVVGDGVICLPHALFHAPRVVDL
jgi:hypothetical protein